MFNVWIFIATLFVADAVIEGQRCFGSRCGDCLMNERCLWCKDQVFYAQRCGSYLELNVSGCKEVVQRKSHTVEILENKEFSDGGPGLDPIQIKPQRIKIRLVPNSVRHYVMLHYKVARNFPLDLYFLHDPSKSMENLITSLTQLTNDIANEISNITTDFRFGLGTAMDKVISPFVRRDPKYLNHPCGTPYIYCDHPYSFLHRQSLTANKDAFKAALGKVNRTGNQDIVEGLFDGLMQVMVCGDKIGWRRKARRMVVYATDVNFHQAGDGRTAGILEPNDGLCHLDDKGYYTKAEIQDYPSVGQIIQKARDNNVNVIFVIGGKESGIMRSYYYDELTRHLPGNIHNASALSNDSNNILDIIRENYRKLRETVKLSTDGVPEELVLGFYSNCGTGRMIDQTNVCEGLNFETWVNFTIAFQSNMTTCPSQRSFNMTIFPEGLEDRVRIEVEHECECDCQREPEAEPNSTNCNQRGTYECGVCNCNEGWSGDSCECDERLPEAEVCGTEAGICNNVGNCTCSKCYCYEGYSGELCECNDRNCPYHNGSLCGGPDHGNCSCGKCLCTSEFSGASCDCQTSKETCRDHNGTMCSNHGVCECGRCRCDVGFRGTLCDTCLACPISCEKNFNCAQCVGFNQGPFNSTMCSKRCKHVAIVPLLNSEDLDSNFTRNHISCFRKDMYGCLLFFDVYDSDDVTTVHVKSSKRCSPKPMDPLTIGIGISGAVFLAGLIIIVIWKILILIYDRAEYSKFEAEIKDPVWEKSDSPIYHGCITTVHNPMSDLSNNLYPDIQKYQNKIDNTPLDFIADTNPQGLEDIGINDIFSDDLGQLLDRKAKSVHFADDQK
uniref:Integrin beta n=1 Tax=Magallana gigas TaxID=29159 RepID=A0A8W8MKP3_MAGGI|nr:integrin beta pat-3-like isoform X3 [Crassostrea gigas]